MLDTASFLAIAGDNVCNRNACDIPTLHTRTLRPYGLFSSALIYDR